MASQFLTGILGPLRRDQKSDFANGSGIELRRANIRQVIGTRAGGEDGGGELPWQSDFGSHVHRLRQRNQTPAMKAMALEFVRSALRKWLPDETIVGVDTIPGPRTRLILRVRFANDPTRPAGESSTVDVTL